ncbi:hypothetical protein SAMN05444166_7958 [Singulisphaera sp. GP187]|uniref:hypothetical protein n=1 Tax=Singulisphaera sp. GP187 TaxID=1882752 RepID=UPI00092AE467|nr:hypothetical protein [Singulisphaera sp. GP187]SIO66100.1 hypothetical protein SAMN05444166_7958 [Singulisphaera sp. GP187]
MMDQPNDRIMQALQRDRYRRGRGAGTAVLALIAMIVGLGLLGSRELEAQAKANRAPVSPSHVRMPMDYRQVQVVWTHMAETLNKWEEKGWETFEIVPIQPANPGVGAPMTVAILFRRPAK